MDFSDSRLTPLAQRMKARGQPELLDAEEQEQWQDFVAAKLHGEGDWLNLRRFHTRLDELSESLEAAGEATKLEQMQQLRDYGLALADRYPEPIGADSE